MGHKKPRKVLGISVWVAVITFLVILILSIMLGILPTQSLINLNKIIGNLKDIFFSLVLLILVGFVLYVLVKLASWVIRDDGVVIKPFQVGGWTNDKDSTHNGQSIADLLIRDLLRIRRVHDNYREIQKKSGTYRSKKLIIPSIAPVNENIAYNIANIGNVNQAGSSISVGEIMIALKKLSGNHGLNITGSLHKYGSIISLVAWMGHKEAKSWEVKQVIYDQKIEDQKKTALQDEVITFLVRQLAYEISKDIGGTKAKTYKSLMHFTQALNNYYCYTLTKDEKSLIEAIKNCEDAVESDKNYKETAELLYSIGTEYFYKGINAQKEKEDKKTWEKFLIKSEDTFKKSISIKPDDIYSHIGLATTLDVLDENEVSNSKFGYVLKLTKEKYDKITSLERIFVRLKKLKYVLTKKEDFRYIDKINELEYQLFLIHNNRSSVLNDLRKYKDAIDCLNEAEKMAKKLDGEYMDHNSWGALWYTKGYILTNQKEYDKALKYLNKSIEVIKDSSDPILSSVQNIKGIALFNSGEYEEAIECFNKAIKQNPENLDIWDTKGLISKNIPREVSRKSSNGILRPMTPKNEHSHPLINKSLALCKLKKYDDSIKCLKEAIDKGIEMELADSRMKKIYEKKGNKENYNSYYDQAIKLYTENIDQNPDDITSLNNKGIALFNSGEYEEAIKVFDKVIDRDQYALDPWIYKGNVYYDKRNFQEALNLYEKAIKIDSSLPYTYFNKGSALSALCRYDEALKSYEEAIKLDKFYFEAWNGKGLVFSSLFRYDEAIENFDRALEIYPDYDLALVNKGFALMGLLDYEGAVSCMDEAISINPENPDNRLNKGILLNQMAKYDEAIDAFADCINLDQNNATAWNNKGIALVNLFRYEEATECYQNAIGICKSSLNVNSNNIDDLINLSSALIGLGKYEDALDCYNKALEINSLNPDNLNSKGWLLSNFFFKYEDAIRCFDQALKTNPNHEWALFNKAFAQQRLFEYNESLNCLENVININPNNELALINRGFVLAELKRYDETVSFLDRAIEINPGNPENWYSKGSLLNKICRYEEAVLNFDKALEISPKHSNALSDKAFALSYLNHSEEAKEYYEKSLEIYDKAMQMNPKDFNALCGNIFVFNELANYNNAIEFLDTYLELNPKDEWALKEKGRALISLKNYDESLKCIDQSINLKEDYSYAWHSKGLLFLELGKYEEALGFFEKAIDLFELDPEYWKDKAVALIKMEKYKKALESLEKSIELNQVYAIAWKLKGDALEALGKYEEAENARSEAFELNPL